MLTKDPANRIKLADVKQHPWVTCNDTLPLPSEAENCGRKMVTVTDEEINSSVTVIPNIYTVVSIYVCVLTVISE